MRFLNLDIEAPAFARRKKSARNPRREPFTPLAGLEDFSSLRVFFFWWGWGGGRGGQLDHVGAECPREFLTLVTLSGWATLVAKVLPTCLADPLDRKWSATRPSPIHDYAFMPDWDWEACGWTLTTKAQEAQEAHGCLFYPFPLLASQQSPRRHPTVVQVLLRRASSTAR